MTEAPLSVVVLTLNEELNIGACLESVAGWADELIVVDSGSTDSTLEIVRRFTDRVFFHDYVDHSTQLEWVLSELPTAHVWLLVLDADNVVSPRMRAAISEALAEDDPDVAGYFTRHKYFFRGGPVRGFKPWGLKVVRRNAVTLDKSEFVDYRFVVDGRTERLPGELIEDNRKERSIDFWIEKHRRFASRSAAEEVLRRHRRIAWRVSPRLFGSPDERIIWLKNRWYRMPLFVRPFLYFGYRYVLRGGFLDGANGLVYHLLHALWYRLVIDLRIAELEHDVGAGRVTLEELEAVAR